MEIHWYGHAAFLITTEQGIKIITKDTSTFSFTKEEMKAGLGIVVLQPAL